MRLSLLGLLAGVALVAALAVAPAQAKNCGSHTVAPPGNSGVNQYVEHVPTACGDKPTSGTQGGGVGGGAGGPGGPGGPGSGSGISGQTASQLAKLGAAGKAAAAFAQATAPSRGKGSGGQNGNHGSVSGATAGGSGSSPITSLVKALTGSSSGGGLGTFLPILLVATLIGVTGIALLRRRRAT